MEAPKTGQSDSENEKTAEIAGRVPGSAYGGSESAAKNAQERAWRARHGDFATQEGSDSAHAREIAVKAEIDDLVPECPDCGRAPSEYAAHDLEWQRQVIENHRRNPEATGFARRFKYCCDECSEAREKKKQRKAQMEMAHHAVNAAYGSGLMPDAARECSWRNSIAAIEEKNPDAWAAAKNTTAGNLWICGHPGTGKTFMARCIANAALDEGLSAGEISAMDIRSWSMQRVDEEVRKWAKPHILIIDDLDKLPPNDWSLGHLFLLLDKRASSKGKRIIITANTTGALLAATWKQVAARTMWPMVTSIFERILPASPILLAGGSNRER